MKWVAARRVHPSDFDDATQDGLIGLIRAHRRFDPDLGDGWYDRWMCLAIERAIIDGNRTRTHYRRRGGKPVVVSIEHVVVVDDGVPLRVIDVMASGDSTDETVLADGLEDWLRALPLDDPADRRVLDGLLDGRKQQDIAETEGVTLSRISQRVRHIREVIARRI